MPKPITMQIVNYSIKYLPISFLLFGAFYGNAQQTTPGNPASMNLNHLRTWNAVKPDTNRNNFTLSNGLQTALITTDYFDGLGRPIQKVVKQGSYPTGGSAVDMIIPTIYDEFGREAIKYLPFPANTAAGNTSVNDGIFKLNPFHQDSAFSSTQYSGETWFYSQTNFEVSPLNRVLENFAPGNSWVGTSGQASEASRHSIKSKFWINTLTDSVRIWSVTESGAEFGSYASNSFYPAGSLFKNVTVDELGNQVIEFKDKDEKVLLKKVQLTSSADAGSGKGYYGWLCTYFIYDYMSRLRAVIQPAGVETLRQSGWSLTTTLLNEQCFRYEYDARNRRIINKVPGAGPVRMVYDSRDRLVLSQDSMSKNQGNWLYTIYDQLNRETAKGIWHEANNRQYHAAHADTSISYPNASAVSSGLLSEIYYDDYSWRASHGNPLSSTRSNILDGNLLSPSNTTWPYPQDVTQTNHLTSLVTGGWVDRRGYFINFYDNSGRLIQKKSQNPAQNTDYESTQYTWDGKPLLTIFNHVTGDLPGATTEIFTKSTYDDLGRIITTEKAVASTLAPSTPFSYHPISELSYDALGNLASKKLGRKKDNTGAYTSSPLETQYFSYNIRGWLLGMNKGVINDQLTANFGYELTYDKRTSIFDNYSTNIYSKAQFNGNIGGLIWKSVGDGEKRKYDFDYDATNRFLKADFTQYNSGWNISAGVDYSVQMGDGIHADSAYDANGNILAMKQKGYKVLAGSTTIDDLRYTYLSGTNRLIEVVDAVNDPDSKLGDFKDIENPEIESGDDYYYDGNGNLLFDRNKDNWTMQYNHLNQPTYIGVDLTSNPGYGEITFIYDGLGNKWKKVLNDHTQFNPVSRITEYLNGGFVYEIGGGETIVRDLKFFPHEEGRVRFKPGNEEREIPATLVFDYFIKDHLGNVRMVLTEDQQTDAYIPASLETDNLGTEGIFYGGLDSGRVEINTVTDYPNDTYTDPNEFAQKLSGSGPKIGTNISLRVMAGDKFNIRANSWYKLNGGTPASPVNPLSDLLAALNPGVGTVSSGHGGPGTEVLETNSVLDPAATTFLNSQSGYDTTKPKAFLNWVLFDDQFRLVSSSSGFQQVGNNNEFKTHTVTEVNIAKNGYLYVYVNNETPNINVYFDNLQVTHIRGPLLEESSYYPFGLEMQGISSKAVDFGDPQNLMNKFQGQEFNPDMELNFNEFKWRTYNPQIGRFIQIDPLSNKYVYNSTFAFSENKVISFVELEGLEAKPLGIGAKFTSKISQEVEIANSGVGDKISVKHFEGETRGESGVMGTMKMSTETKVNENGKTTVKTKGATAGFISFAIGDDKSLELGVDIFGYEAHIGVDISKGVGLSAGGSHTDEKGHVTGTDTRFQAGAGTLTVLVGVLAKTLFPWIPLPAPAVKK
jgi:RHS repeat-associated protein